MAILTYAIATENNQVCTHFGTCQDFTLLTVRDGKIQRKWKKLIENWKCCEKEKKVSQLGMNILITNRIGKRACELFTKQGIQVYTGVQGEVDSVIQNILSEEGIEKNFNPCACEHELEGHCPKKTLKSCHSEYFK